MSCKRLLLVANISIFPTKISILKSELEILPNEHFIPVTGMKMMGCSFCDKTNSIQFVLFFSYIIRFEMISFNI